MTILRHLSTGTELLAQWWVREWQASLPNALRAWTKASRAASLTIRPHEDHVAISLSDPEGRDKGVEQIRWIDYSRDALDHQIKKAAAFAPLGKIRIVLELPQAMTQSMIIPRRAQARAEEIVRENISRKTPLKPDEVFIGYDLRAAGSGKLELRYLLLPKAILERFLTRLSVVPSEIAMLKGSSVNGVPAVAVPIAHRPQASSPWLKRVFIGLALVSVLGALVGYAALAWRQAALLAEMEERIAEMAAHDSESSERLRPAFALSDDIARFGELRRAPGIVQVWDELARILPDSTFLTDLEVSGSNLRAAGYSDAAAGLIQLLEKSPVVHSAAFTGPLVFDPARGKERFSLRASLRMARLPAEEGR
jgi:Tfp pilus assembly protein PilN